MILNLYIKRVVAAGCFIFIMCVMLIARLYFLSTDSNTALEVLSGQYTRKDTVAQRNGFIYDANGNLFSHINDGKIIIVKPNAKSDRNTVVGYLADCSGYEFDNILEKYNKLVPFTMQVQNAPERTPPEGVYIYPSYSLQKNSICRHLLGFNNSDGKGVDGIYKIYEKTIDEYSGSLSYKYTANAQGGILDGGSFYVEDRGYTDEGGIMLTVDGDLQRKVDEICDKYMDMGAVVISELSTGNILALSSRPLYDRDNVASCLDSDHGELINRAFSRYTPGSVFKAIIAAASLEKDEKLYNFEYECTGKCNVSGKEFKCHKTDGHGVQTMKQGFANSCNTYFINLLFETGFEYTLTFCNKIGLGNSHVIDGFLVNGACIPDPVKKYPDAYKANFAFGQGNLMLSCIDVLNIYSVCSTGFIRDFTVIKGICTDLKNPDIIFEPKKAQRVISDSTVLKMREMMRECVTNGTGQNAAVSCVEAGGKTATAQSGQYKNGKEVLHKWFAGVFPIDKPEYAVTVLCDGNGERDGNAQKIFSLCSKSVIDICYD